MQRLAAPQVGEAVAALGQHAGNRAVTELLTRSRAQQPARPPDRQPRPGAAPRTGSVQRFLGGGITGALEAVREMLNVDIAASVGAGGRNRPADVRRVQMRLVLLGFLAAGEAGRERPASADDAGVPDAVLSATVAAIQRYQTDVVGLRRADGRVDARGRTQRALAAALKTRPAPSEAAGGAGPGTATTTSTGAVTGAGGGAQGLGTASGVTAEEFRRRHADALKDFRGSEDEIALLVDMIVRRGITDVDALRWTRKPTHEWALAPAVFAKRHGHERLAKPSAEDTREMGSIKFGLVYPLLQFVVPRVTAAPAVGEDATVGQRIAAASFTYIGTRYVLGGCEGKKTQKSREDCGLKASHKSDGIDCSGLVVRTLGQLGLPYKWGSSGGGVARFVGGGTFIQHSGSPEAGDLLLRQKDGNWTHIGIYVGSGSVVHSPYTGTVVRKESYKSDKWDSLKLRYPPATAKE